VTFTDSAPVRNPSGGCQPSGGALVCAFRANLDLFLGDGDDTARVVGTIPTRFTGGTGADSLIGGPADDSFNSEPVNLPPPDGPDAMVGGAGRDTVSYGGGHRGVSVSLDGVANDGDPGEGDDVGADIEVVFGTAGDDTFIGAAGAQSFLGEDGDDVLDGGGGRDTLVGGDGTDLVSYARERAPVRIRVSRYEDETSDLTPTGNPDVFDDVEGVIGGQAGDVLIGDGFSNRLIGGRGNDRIAGGKGADVIDGGDGNDSIDAFDKARDQVACGSGRDGLLADSRDAATRCEARQRGPALTVSALVLRRGQFHAIGRCSRYAVEPCAVHKRRRDLDQR